MMDRGADEFAVSGTSGCIDVTASELVAVVSHVVCEVYKGWTDLLVELDATSHQ